MSDANGAVFSEKQWKAILARVPPLSSRQQQICRLILRGMSDKQIAGGIGISVPTVRTHLERVFEKLDVQDRTELAMFLVRGFLSGCRNVRCPRWQ